MLQNKATRAVDCDGSYQFPFKSIEFQVIVDLLHILKIAKWILIRCFNCFMVCNGRCDICSKTFSSGMRLKQHKGRHRRFIERPFICDICSKSFRYKETITRHLFTTHINTEPKFECEVCHKRYVINCIYLINSKYSKTSL